MEDFFVLFFEDAAASDSAARLEGERAIGGLFDEANHDGTVEVAAVEDAHDTCVVTARMGFGLGDDGAGFGFRSTRDTSCGEEVEEEVAQSGRVVDRELAYDFRTRLEQRSAMGFEAVDVAIAAHLDLGGDDAEVVSNEVDDGGVFGTLFGVGEKMLGSVGSGVGCCALHGVRRDLSVADANKGFGRETHEAVAPPKAIARCGTLEELGEREVGVERDVAGEVGEKAIARMEIVLYDLKGAGVCFERWRLWFPKWSGGSVGAFGRGGAVVELRKGVANFLGINLVEGLHEDLLFGIVDDEEEGAGRRAEGVHLGDGVSSRQERHITGIMKRRTFAGRVRRDGKTENRIIERGEDVPTSNPTHPC